MTDTITRQKYKNIITISVMILLTAVILLFYFFTINSKKQNDITDTTSNIYTQQYNNDIELNLSDFNDGLGHPDNRINQIINNQTYTIDTFNRDINSDGKIDKITRTHIENETAHFYDEYKIELNIDGILYNITPDDFRTINGADCALQLLHFTFNQNFGVKKISRPWQDTWDTPTMATKTEYRLYKNTLKITENQPLTTICDVSELF